MALDNKDVQFHLLSIAESNNIYDLYTKFLVEVNKIVRKANLPEGVWMPSVDFKWLIKQLEAAKKEEK